MYTTRLDRKVKGWDSPSLHPLSNSFIQLKNCPKSQKVADVLEKKAVEESSLLGVGSFLVDKKHFMIANLLKP